MPLNCVLNAIHMKPSPSAHNYFPLFCHLLFNKWNGKICQIYSSIVVHLICVCGPSGASEILLALLFICPTKMGIMAFCVFFVFYHIRHHLMPEGIGLNEQCRCPEALFQIIQFCICCCWWWWWWWKLCMRKHIHSVKT